MAKKTVQVEEEQETDQISDMLSEKEFKGLHYGDRSGTEIVAPDIISTGSFIFDQILGGGFRSSSWVRFYSEPECGKTSMALTWGKNWQDFYGDQGCVVFFNAEGRITKDLLLRSGIDTSKNRFRIIDCNISDVIYTIIERLVSNNPNDLRYFFIVDSTDACQRSIDIGKNLGESEKIGGSATILSAAGKRLSLIFNRMNHVLFMTSQVRDKVNTHGPGGGGKDASGGNAPKFYSSLTGEIKKPWTDTYLFENPSDKKSKIIGRRVQIKLIKTPNESTGALVEYPVKYGLGVWRAYEAFMVGQMWGWLTGAKGRFAFDEKLLQELKEQNIQAEEKFHGEQNVRNYFDEQPELVEYILNKAKSLSQ